MLMKCPFTFARIAPVALLALCFASTASAQYTGLITDVPVITVGHGGVRPNDGAGYCTSAALGCLSSYGATNATLVDGLTIAAFVDLPGSARSGEPYLRTMLAVTGFSADPGTASLAWADCGGVIYRGAQASNYSYTGGRATWYWGKVDGAQPAFLGRTSVSCSIYRVGDSGWVRPKYQVAGLTYAPPGSRSSVTYKSGFMNGTNTTQSRTFTNGVTYTESISISGGVKYVQAVFSGNGQISTSGGWSQAKESNSSTSLTEQTANGLIVPGPASSAAGVNHDYDTVYVWLNPEIFMMVFNTSVVSGGYGYDARDPVIGMDVVPLTVGQLKGIQPIPPNLWARLNRTWDTDLGGLTTADFQDIVRADPFATNPGFNPNTDTSHRFEMPLSGNPPLPANLLVNYTPAPPGAQPNGQTYSTSYSATTAAGQMASETYERSYSVDHTGSVTWYATLTVKTAQTNKWSTTEKWSSTVTNGASQSADFTIFPPFATDNYTGPTAIQVWKDNVYGTFMFYPLF
jgi:hypothetical protein